MKNKITFTVLILFCLFLSACTSGQSQKISNTATNPVQQTIQPIEEPTVTTQPTETPTNIPTQRPSPTPWFTPTAGPTPIGGSEWVVFSVSERKAEQYVGLGVYLFNLPRGELIDLFGEGYTLQAVSPDGKWLLINQGKNLYLSGLFAEDPVLISERFENYAGQTALWINNGASLLWLERDGSKINLVLTDGLASVLPKKIDYLPHSPLMLFPSPVDNQIMWRAGSCSDATDCSAGVWVSDLSSQQSTHLSHLSYPGFDRDKNLVGLVQEGDLSVLSITNFDLSFTQVLDLQEDYPASYRFSPLGKRVAVLAQVRSDYSGKNYGNRVLLFSSPDWKTEEIGALDGLNGSLIWSPDGENLVMMSTMIGDSGYAIELSTLSLKTGQQESYSEKINLNADDFIFVSNLAWVP